MLPNNAQAVSHEEARREHIFLRLAVAMQKLTEGASPHVGADCLSQAKLAQAVLRDIGINTILVAGEAAWRIGAGDGDVVVHSPQISGSFPISPGTALPIHVWLRTEEGEILDITTHSLRIKAAALDALDGGKTTVEWCPPYLLAKPRKTTLKEVTMAPEAGVFHYRELPGLLLQLNAHQIGAGEVDATDLAVLKTLFENPEIHFVGVNHRRSADHLIAFEA